MLRTKLVEVKLLARLFVDLCMVEDFRDLLWQLKPFRIRFRELVLGWDKLIGDGLFFLDCSIFDLFGWLLFSLTTTRREFHCGHTFGGEFTICGWGGVLQRMDGVARERESDVRIRIQFNLECSEWEVVAPLLEMNFVRPLAGLCLRRVLVKQVIAGQIQRSTAGASFGRNLSYRRACLWLAAGPSGISDAKLIRLMRRSHS